jgi:hypothetical protein
MTHKYGEKWTLQEIEENILKCIEVLGLDRMPTSREILAFYDNHTLHNAIQRSKKYSGWAKYLNLQQTHCETRTGNKYEQIAMSILSDKGYKVEKMSFKSHFDLLVNNKVKVDVKSGGRWYKQDENNEYQVNTFGINKKYATCDIYMMFVLKENEEIEKVLIVPSFEIRCKTSMSIGKNSKYLKWTNRFDVLDKYIDFTCNVVI